MARNATRKNRKNSFNGAGAANAAPANATPAMRKSRKQEGGKRKGRRGLSPALKAWNERVMAVYREMKKKNPNTRLRDAMKEAKKRS
jgi:hypothetical protein